MIHKPPHTLIRNRPCRKLNMASVRLSSFYKWCREIGHYHAYEAVERFMEVPV